MSKRGKSIFWWGLRILALGAVAYVLSTQIHWWDRLDLKAGGSREGVVQRTEGRDWRVTGPQGEVVEVAAEDVETRGGASSPVPAVSWGLRTLALRLAGRVPVVILVLAVLASLLVLTAWRWRLLMRTAGMTLTLPRAIRLTFIGAFFNSAVPGATGGDVVKAWYAARITGRGTRSVIAVFGDRMIGMLGLTVLAGVALLVAPDREGFASARLVIAVAFGLCLVGLAVFALPRIRQALALDRLLRRLPFQTLIAEARGALRLYRGHPVALLVAFGVSVFNHAANVFCVWLLAGALGIEGLDLGTALALVPVANFFSGIPILPGGWGVGELAFAFFLGQVGVPPTEAVGLSVVYRLSLLAVSLPGGLLWMFWKGRPTKAAIEKGLAEATQDLDGTQTQPGGSPLG